MDIVEEIKALRLFANEQGRDVTHVLLGDFQYRKLQLALSALTRSAFVPEVTEFLGLRIIRVYPGDPSLILLGSEPPGPALPAVY